MTFVFRLRTDGSVRFVLERCGLTDRFTVHGHSGVNRIRFRGKVHGRRLAPGTYRVRARSHGRTVLRTRLVVTGTASPCALSGGAANDAASMFAALGLTSGGSPKQPGNGGGKTLVTQAVPAKAPKRDSGGVLGAHASKLVPGSGKTQLALLIVLLTAIGLLTVGALPRAVVPNAAAAAFLARRRAIFAGAGLAALGAFLVSYFLG